MITRPIVIIDGVVQDSADAHVSMADAAFSLGEGILETMLVVDGQIVREARHRARAQRGLQSGGAFPRETDRDSHRVAQAERVRFCYQTRALGSFH